MNAAYFLPFFVAAYFSFPTQVHAKKVDDEVTAQDVVATILATRDPVTKISPSHIGHPGYEKLAFIYDKAVDALILHATGHQQEAEDILDYFAARLDIPDEKLNDNVDSNGIYGIVKSMNIQRRDPIKALTNAIDITSTSEAGASMLEFSTTPGPNSFIIFAFLTVNPKKYLPHATMLGEALLSMQDNEGGIRDGDRAPERVYTEPHVDAYAAFLMLYQLTNDEIWLTAATRSEKWFYRYVYHPERRSIDQGLWAGITNTIFALDCYSWTMAGPIGEKMNLVDLRKLTDSMLRRGMTLIRVTLPDEKTKSLLLMDFTNSEDPRTLEARGGLHPMGTIEWTGGVILALQKNAVRLWEANHKTVAVAYKALAEVLLEETKKSFYTLDGKKITFYATGQGLEVARFGGLIPNNASGWRTPFYYSKKNGRTLLKGGSLIGAWTFLPELRSNPFILNDPYGKVYDKIPSSRRILREARSFLVALASERIYTEQVSKEIPDASTQIVEPKFYNKKMWEEINNGIVASNSGNKKGAREFYRKAMDWANKVVENPVWIKLAQRENSLKEREVGGLVSYQWGKTADFNPENAASEKAIWRYPLLNEIAVSMWALAMIYQELDDVEHSEYWIKRILNEVPLHQIATMKNNGEPQEKGKAVGYWNALVSWQDNIPRTAIDQKMKNSYVHIVKEDKLLDSRPKFVTITQILGYNTPPVSRFPPLKNKGFNPSPQP